MFSVLAEGRRTEQTDRELINKESYPLLLRQKNRHAM